MVAAVASSGAHTRVHFAGEQVTAVTVTARVDRVGEESRALEAGARAGLQEDRRMRNQPNHLLV